jgi:hypothetical protein
MVLNGHPLSKLRNARDTLPQLRLSYEHESDEKPVIELKVAEEA